MHNSAMGVYSGLAWFIPRGINRSGGLLWAVTPGAIPTMADVFLSFLADISDDK